MQVFTITVSPGQEAAADTFARSLAKSAKQTYCLGGTLKYELPASEVSLSQIFDAVAEARMQGLGVVDWGVHSASLEDVFIRLASAEPAADLTQLS